MDRLVDHLFVFEGNGNIKDFNGTYAEYRALKRTENTSADKSAAPEKAVAAAPKPGMTNTERNEMRKLERDIATAEARKREILEKFNGAEISPEEIGKLSAELGKLQESLDEKEMRWLELAEKG
jgi:ATP-binding cassette subfamily F protein uup